MKKISHKIGIIVAVLILAGLMAVLALKIATKAPESTEAYQMICQEQGQEFIRTFDNGCGLDVDKYVVCSSGGMLEDWYLITSRNPLRVHKMSSPTCRSNFGT